jgi:signal transduction histidine kinase
MNFEEQTHIFLNILETNARSKFPLTHAEKISRIGDAISGELNIERVIITKLNLTNDNELVIYDNLRNMDGLDDTIEVIRSNSLKDRSQNSLNIKNDKIRHEAQALHQYHLPIYNSSQEKLGTILINTQSTNSKKIFHLKTLRFIALIVEKISHELHGLLQIEKQTIFWEKLKTIVDITPDNIGSIIIQLQNQKNQLLETNSTHQQFIKLFCHELANPISILKMSIDDLNSHPLVNDLKHIQKMERSINKLQNFLEKAREYSIKSSSEDGMINSKIDLNKIFSV